MCLPFESSGGDEIETSCFYPASVQSQKNIVRPRDIHKSYVNVMKEASAIWFITCCLLVSAANAGKMLFVIVLRLGNEIRESTPWTRLLIALQSTTESGRRSLHTRRTRFLTKVFWIVKKLAVWQILNVLSNICRRRFLPFSNSIPFRSHWRLVLQVHSIVTDRNMVN